MTAKFPPPSSLQGDYSGTCVVCLQGTDSGLGFRGEAEWVIAGLVRLGVPYDHAVVMLEHATGMDPGKAIAGEVTLNYRVCERCASAKGMAVGLVDLGIPVYPQPTR